MVQMDMLVPAAALVVWSLVALGWMVVTRFAGMGSIGARLKQSPPGGRGQDLQGVLPDKTMWKSHNYTHLMEQPTVFYPVVVILALTGASQLDITLAWIYVALRVVHTFWQNLVNTIPMRVTIFTLSTVVLAILAVRALLATLG